MEDRFWKALAKEDAVLIVDNDSCCVSFEEEGGHESFDYTPDELVFIFAEKLNIIAEKC